MQTIGLPELIVNLQGMKDRCKSLLPVMKAGAISARSEIQQRFQTQMSVTGQAWPPLKYPRIRGGDIPLNDTGRLKASFGIKVEDFGFTVGTAEKQAAAMNFGATIVPKRGKFLCIPMTKAAQRAGSPRNMPGLRVVIYRGGKSGAMFDQRGMQQWLLVKQTIIPPRPFMGFSAEWVADFSEMAVSFITTGSL